MSRLLTNPHYAARRANLYYVNDDDPGYSRERRGRGFAYYTPTGKLVSSERVKTRLKSLVIPPAWAEVWICKDTKGHIQATGRDAKERKQYLYHPKWHEVRDRAKFAQLHAFGKALPSLRRQLKKDTDAQELSKTKVVAAIIRLLELSLIRIGSDQYAKSNKTHGLTTLRTRHVEVEEDEISFNFVGKGGIKHDISLQDKTLATIIRDCEEIPGYRLFQYLEDGEKCRVESSDVNEYLQSKTAESFSAKDFRTWAATVETAKQLHNHGFDDRVTVRKKKENETVKDVAARLGNTPTVCRNSYIHPQVLEHYHRGSLSEHFEAAKPVRGLKKAESALLNFLEAVGDDQ